MKIFSNSNSKRISQTAVLCLSVLVSATNCGEFPGGSDGTEINETNKKIGVLIFDDALTSDMTGPLEVFGHASHQPDFEYQVLAISVAADRNATTYEGLQLKADYSIADAPDLDVLIVPGSYSMDPLFANADLLNFLKTQGARVEYLASNCAGAFLLGHAGLLDGGRATPYKGGDGGHKKKKQPGDAQIGPSIDKDGN
ncbi:MAG: DJ-1/PfpI family protein, partial [Leptospirales bacterium]